MSTLVLILVTMQTICELFRFFYGGSGVSAYMLGNPFQGIETILWSIASLYLWGVL